MPAVLGPRHRPRATFLGRCVRRCLALSAAKYAFPLMLALFLVHATREGDLHHWGLLFSALGDDPVWLAFAASAVAALAYRLPARAWLLPLMGFVAFGDLELVFGGIAWLAQLLYLMKELVLGVLCFADASLHAWLALLRSCVGSPDVRPLAAESLAAAGLQQLWLVRIACACVAAWLRRRRARDELEMDLRCALQRPFHAEFQTDFARADPGAAQQAPLETPKRQLRRSFSFTFVHTNDISAIEVQRLQEKHTAMLVARQAALEESAEFADMAPEMLTLEVRRSHLLEDSWEALLKAPTEELLAPGLSLSYVGELGVDAGGIARDWFDALGEALVEGAEDDQGASLLALGKSSRMLIPRPAPSAVADEARCREMLLAGRFLALGAVHGGRPLPLPLSPLVCKYIVGEPVDMADVERLDPAFYRERVAPLLRQGGLAELEAALGEPLTFVSTPTELRPAAEELEPGGAARLVTEANLSRYLQLLCEAFLCSEIRHELQCLLRGFWDVLPQEALRGSGLSAWDLAALISGTRGIDLGEWRANSQEEGEEEEGGQDASSKEASQEVVSWFWEVLQELNEEQRRLLLRFVTGCGRLPPGGFQSLSPPFTVAVSRAGSPDHLPHANTCVNRLVLHRYGSQQKLRTKIHQVLATRDFGFA